MVKSYLETLTVAQLVKKLYIFIEPQMLLLFSEQTMKNRDFDRMEPVQIVTSYYSVIHFSTYVIYA
jgi:hypothetical protein